jgi:hypothetical protein
LAAADARPIAPVAIVKANVLNTPLLPAAIFMGSSISCLLSSGDRQREFSRPINLLTTSSAYRAQKNPRAHVAFQESVACIFRCKQPPHKRKFTDAR